LTIARAASALENEDLRAAKMGMDFGGRFAYKGGDAPPGKSSEGEQNG
jgi:hypothetical protein